MSAQQAGSVRASPLTPQRLSPSALLSSRRRLHPSASRAQSSSSNENVSPAVVLSVAKEIRKLCTEPLDGIKVQLNEEDVTDIIAEIHGPGALRLRACRACRACCACRASQPRLCSSVARVAARIADSTPFEGGVYKVKLTLPTDYPHAPPKGARARALLLRCCRCCAPAAAAPSMH